jgi:hypothetical protein
MAGSWLTGAAPTMMTGGRSRRDSRDRSPAGPTGHRPLTRLTVASLAAHVVFELGAGVGMPLASVIGPYVATGFWALATSGVWVASARDASTDKVLAAANGFGIAAVSAHLLGWPTRRTRTGLPWLEDCEGLGPELMPFYNPILYLSGSVGLLAILRERTALPPCNCRWPCSDSCRHSSRTSIGSTGDCGGRPTPVLRGGTGGCGTEHAHGTPEIARERRPIDTHWPYRQF